MGTNLTNEQIASSIEHTALKQMVTEQDIYQLCDEAEEYEFGAVCVYPVFVPIVKRRISPDVRITSVANFPMGNSPVNVVIQEIKYAIDYGANEIDMVAPLYLAQEKRWHEVSCFVDKVIKETGDSFIFNKKYMKIILETGLFDAESLVNLIRSIDSNIGFLKTSTGFGPRGATIKDIEVIKGTNPTPRIKASGGIKTAEQAKSMLEAGATRLGTSSGVAIMKSLK